MIANKKIDRTLERLLKWSEKPQWIDFLDQTYFKHLNYSLDNLDILDEEMDDILNEESLVSMNSAITEDFFTGYFGENGELNVINDYLKRRGSREPTVCRQFLRTLLDSYVSFYEIVEVDAKGRTVKVRDLLQENTTLTIQNSSDTNDWVIWDCAGARVVSMNGKNYFTRGALLLNRRLAKELVETVYIIAREVEREISKRARTAHQKPAEIPSMSLDVFCSAAPISTMLTHARLSEAVAIAETTLSDMDDEYDEDFIECEVMFPILGDASEVIAKIDEMEEFERLGETLWNWYELDSSADLWNTHQRNNGSPDSENISKPNESLFEDDWLGSVEIHQKSLVLSVNSAEWADIGKMLIESRLGNLVGQSLTTYQDEMPSMKEVSDLTNKEPLIVNREPSAFEDDAQIEEFYRRILDQPIRNLGNKTLKKAATTEKGRREVVEWLKNMENFEHRQSQYDGNTPPDMTWIWKELKIEIPRY